MSKEATEFFRKERLALEQEAKRAKEQNKALKQELERMERVISDVGSILDDEIEFGELVESLKELVEENLRKTKDDE